MPVLGTPTDFGGRPILVTGGASGIGLATARHVVGLGARVALVDLNEAAGIEAAAEIEAAAAAELGPLAGGGPRAIAVCADVTDPASVERAFAEVGERFGSVYGLVVSAGIRQPAATIADLDLDLWDRVLGVDLRGAFLTLQVAARVMGVAPADVTAAGELPEAELGHAGSIVTLGSLSGTTPRIGQAAYCAAKAGVIALTGVLALELANRGVRVNTVCPGPTATPFMGQWSSPGESSVNDRVLGNPARYRPGVPLRRIGKAEDVATAITHLLAPESAFITGQSLFVDGGESIF
jgi:NAD(P)-dependent dehydrogenase (short-subunit alcohol dehydrogenase family)